MQKNNVELVNGKFINILGKEVKPVFGDRDQIEAIRRYEKTYADLEGDGVQIDDIDVETEYTVIASFRCPCGRELQFRAETEDEDEATDLTVLDRAIKSCYKCKTDYSLKVIDGELFVKKVKK